MSYNNNYAIFLGLYRYLQPLILHFWSISEIFKLHWRVKNEKSWAINIYIVLQNPVIVIVWLKW